MACLPALMSAIKPDEAGGWMEAVGWVEAGRWVEAGGWVDAGKALHTPRGHLPGLLTSGLPHPNPACNSKCNQKAAVVVVAMGAEMHMMNASPLTINAALECLDNIVSSVIGTGLG